MTTSWFEDTSETRGIIRNGRLAPGAEAGIMSFIDGRREIWARRFLQTAIALKPRRKNRQATYLTVTTFALIHGHRLKGSPLMDDVIFATLHAGEMYMP